MALITLSSIKNSPNFIGHSDYLCKYWDAYLIHIGRETRKKFRSVREENLHFGTKYPNFYDSILDVPKHLQHSINYITANSLLERVSLPPRDRGKVCVHSYFPRPHFGGSTLGDITEYVVVVVLIISLNKTYIILKN